MCCINGFLCVFVVCGTMGCEAYVPHKCVVCSWCVAPWVVRLMCCANACLNVSMVCGTMGCEACVLYKCVFECAHGLWHHGL
jgi:hypothetical protein